MIIPIELGTESYDIVLERGALQRIGDYLPLQRKVLVVTDDGVPPAYAAAVAAACETAVTVTLPAGEKTKCFSCYEHLLSQMLQHGFSRGDCVVAVGGGVIGDLSGFAAATYMRGIDFYNVPTTFLSQVDSSIGGKVAIDMDSVKNIVGAFYQPKKVVVDPAVLSTLDARQRSAGIAESIKMAATCDAELFALLERGDGFGADLERVLESSLRIKKAVVEQDPTEKGLRRVLNYGHTIGHAIESSMQGGYLHGECVAMGMLPLCADTVRPRLRRVLEQYGLPVRVSVQPAELYRYIEHDKKMTGDGLVVVYVPQIGCFEFRKAGPAELRAFLEMIE